MPRYLLVLLILLGFLSCRKSPSELPGDFYAMILSDTHISSDKYKDGRLGELVARLNRGDYPGVEFLLINGDCVSRVYKDYTMDNPDTSENRVLKLTGILQGLTIPYYLVMGNHDYKIGPEKDSDAYFSEDEILGMEALWKKWTGFAPYYTFDHHGWRFAVLNSMRGRSQRKHFDEKQLDWLESILEDSMPTVLFSHFPLKTDHLRIWCKKKDLITPDRESRFYSILEAYRENVKGIFVGHGHMWIHDTLFKTIHIYEVESFGDSEKLPFYFAGFKDHELYVSRVVESMGEQK